MIAELIAKMKVTSRTPSTLVVRKRDILAGFHAPPVSRAAEGYTVTVSTTLMEHVTFIHMMADVLRSSHQILAVLSPESIR